MCMSCNAGRLTKRKIIVLSLLGVGVAAGIYFVFTMNDPAIAADVPVPTAFAICPVMCAFMGGLMWFMKYQICMILIGNSNNDLKCIVRFLPIVIISVSTIMMIVLSAYNGGSIVAYATSNNSAVLRSSTNASSLEVLLVPLSNESREEMHFRVGFLQPNTNELQRHVDFDFIIIRDGKEVFRASNQTGQPHIPLHSIPGTMDIPLFTYDFQKTGKYTVKIPVIGILFNPIIPEEAEFRIKY